MAISQLAWGSRAAQKQRDRLDLRTLAKQVPRHASCCFQLADILKRSTRHIVRLAYSDHVRWIEGQILEPRIIIGHDVLLAKRQVQTVGCG
jgi:hypothetical protein